MNQEQKLKAEHKALLKAYTELKMLIKERNKIFVLYGIPPIETGD